MRVHISEEIFLWRQRNIHVHRFFFYFKGVSTSNGTFWRVLSSQKQRNQTNHWSRLNVTRL